MKRGEMEMKLKSKWNQKLKREEAESKYAIIRENEKEERKSEMAMEKWI